MATDNAASAPPRGWSRTLGLLNPLRAVWWLFNNVRFAIFLLLLLTVVSLLGVLIPQVPAAFRGDPISEEMWLRTQEDTFGPLTDPMETLGLFDIFHQRWFALLLGITVASTAAYIISRFPTVLRTITRPRTRVPDRYFDLAPHSFKSEATVEPEALVSALRKRRYKVRVHEEDGTTYVFGDRLQWAALGTFLTHAAVIIFVLAAVVSRVDAFTSQLFLAEGTTLPIFAVSDPEQVQVELLDAHAEFAPDGQPLDYRADLVIYKRGDEVLRCSSTVNSPCGYDGYRFHQAAYFGYGAQLDVRDPATGNLLFGETIALSERTPSPRVRVEQNGEVLLDETVLLTESASANGEEYRAGLIRLEDGTALTFWQPAEGGELLVFEPSSSAESVRASLAVGETEQTGDMSVTYTGTEDIPSTVVQGVPLPESLGGGTGEALLLLQNVVYGTSNTSAGDDGPVAIATGEPRLTIVGLTAQPTVLRPGETASIEGLEYGFGGQREFSGIEVKRDRSDNLVWIAAAAIVVGLMVTFWVPRRRLWAKISAAGLAMAGQAPWHARFGDELRGIAESAGAPAEGTNKKT